MGLWRCRPGRPKARGGSQRWLVVPLVLTLAVLLVDASMHARRQQPEATLDSQAWVDKVLPRSPSRVLRAVELAQVSSGPVATGGVPGSRQPNCRDRRWLGYRPTKRSSPTPAPSEVAPAAGLLQACLAARQARRGRDGVCRPAPAGRGRPSSAVTQMMSAVSDFRVGDSAYQLFTTDLPKLGVTMPASVWATQPGQL